MFYQLPLKHKNSSFFSCVCRQAKLLLHCTSPRRVFAVVIAVCPAYGRPLAQRSVCKGHRFRGFVVAIACSRHHYSHLYRQGCLPVETSREAPSEAEPTPTSSPQAFASCISWLSIVPLGDDERGRTMDCLLSFFFLSRVASPSSNSWRPTRLLPRPPETDPALPRPAHLPAMNSSRLPELAGGWRICAKHTAPTWTARRPGY